MAKTLYSLMLDEEVVREVDALAHRLGTNRSNMVNTLLAQSVNYVTPEQRVQNVFAAIETLMRPSPDLVPLFTRGARSVSLRSALDYKYRPTVTYEVTLTPGDPDTLGALDVCFRTRSGELLTRMETFFRLWARFEATAMLQTVGAAPTPTLAPGKFTRPLLRPHGSLTAEELAEAITRYVRRFDRAMKDSVAGASPEDTAAAARAAVQEGLQRDTLI